MDGEVIIRFQVDGNGKGGKRKPAINKKTGKSQFKYDNTEDRYAQFLSMTALRVSKMAINEAEYQLNRHFTLIDDVRSQRNLKVAKNLVQKSGSLGLTVGFGAITGGWVGALVGGLVQVSSQFVSSSHELIEQDLRLKQETASLQFSRQKVGYSLNVGANGENR